MTALLIVLIFIIFAALMMTRRMPAILAVPAMAVAIAAVARASLSQILDEVITAGSVRIAGAYIAVMAGAVLGRIVLQTGIAESIIRYAAEFGGDRPLVVAITLMIAVVVLFTTLTGLGAVIMVGSLALPIMMSIGVPRRLAGVLFLQAYALGFIFNIAGWKFYEDALRLSREAIREFALTIFVIDALVVIVFLIVAARRMKKYGAWAVPAKKETSPAKSSVPLLAMLAPLLPLALHIWLKWPVPAAFLASAIIGILLTRPREFVPQLTSAAVKGVEDVAPAVILMIGIGMLLNATSLPGVQSALQPLLNMINLRAPLIYVLFFGLLSPLALYRGPLNPYGIGIGLYTLLASSQTLPPLAIMPALMSVVQVQNTCDPTNTHNVWTANYVGMRVEEITRETILYKAAVCICGLLAGVFFYFR